MPSYYSDSAFQDKLLAHVSKDKIFLKKVGDLLTVDDFKPSENGTSGAGWARWVISNLALKYWEKYRTPIGDLLRSEILEHSHRNKLGERQKEILLKYTDHLQTRTLEAGESLVDKVSLFKRERARLNAVQQILDLQEEGSLTDEKMLDICRGVVDTFHPNGVHPVDFLSGKEVTARMHRRANRSSESPPALLIDPLDSRIQMITRGQIGIWLAPPGRGKSIACIHTAVAYALQGYHAMLIECEDPKAVVEDRIDASLTQMPLHSLGLRPKEFKIRWDRLRRMIFGKLTVVDATDERCTMNFLDKHLSDQKERGRPVDALIIDYDGEMVSPIKNKERHDLEIAEIYRQLRSKSSRWDLFTWVAAQSKGGRQHKKILTGDDTAEAQEKFRKCAVMLTIGNGEEIAEDCYFLFVAKHKTDRKMFGVPIIHDQNKGIFYHREKTAALLKKLAKERRQASRESEEGNDE